MTLCNNLVIITMGVHSHKNKLLIITAPKNIYFDLPQDVVTNLMQETDYMLKQNECLAEHTIKMSLADYCPNTSTETIFMNIENNKMNKYRKFVLNLSQNLHLRSLNKKVALQN